MTTDARKLFLIFTLTTFLLIGSSTYALSVIPRKPRPAATPTSQSNAAPETEPTKPPATTPDTPSAPANETAAPTPPPTTPKASTPITAPKPSLPQPSIPLRFTAGSISTAYTSCNYGTLQYTVGGIDISVNQPTTQSFTWRVELNDGTVSESGTDVMPSGTTIWFGFPSTPTYPSMLGTIVGASDGDMARFVITSPNYSAGGWSAAVPVGSEDACRNGQM